MKKITIAIFIILSCSLTFGQLSTTKYLVGGDTILTFASQSNAFQIAVVDSSSQDTVVLERLTIGTGWATVAPIALGTGSYVTILTPGVGMNGGLYYVDKNAQGTFRLRMTDYAPATRSIKVNVEGR